MAGLDLLKHRDLLFRSDQNPDNGDDFGLPNTGASSTGGSGSKPTYTKKSPEPVTKKKSSGVVIILIIIFLVIAVFLIYWFVIRKPPAKQKIAVQPDTTAMHKPDTLVQAPVKVDTVPAKPAAGMIDTINTRTGRYYVVISSSFDSDLANDYAKKLSKLGINCKILGSATDKKFHRLAVADFGTINEANSKAEELKGTYGKDIWVVKY